MLAFTRRSSQTGFTKRRALWFGLGLAILGLCFRASVSGDGVGYYSYLPSVVAHGTFDLGPVFDRFIAINTPVARQFLEITLPNGLTADYKPIGAALLALVGTGAYASVPEVCRSVIRETGSVTPRGWESEFYQNGHGVYRAIYPALEPVTQMISHL